MVLYWFICEVCAMVSSEQHEACAVVICPICDEGFPDVSVYMVPDEH